MSIYKLNEPVSPVDVVKKQKTPTDAVRLVEWHPCGQYRLIGTGNKEYRDTAELLRAFDEQTMHCAQFWEFCHIDDKVQRGNKYQPRFVALWKLQDGRYIIPQAKHYKQAYTRGQRKDSKHAQDMMPNGCPYWCCIYCIRVKNEQESKKKYQAKGVVVK